MNDAEKVAAIERRHELALLDRLLEEAARPVPPAPPHPQPNDRSLRNDLIDLMELLAEVAHTNYAKQSERQRAVVVAMRTRKAS